MNTDLLNRFALIEGFTEDQINLLHPLIDDVTFEANQRIFDQGDQAKFLYFVMEGKVSIRFNPEDGPVLSVAELDEGDVFGWSAAMGSECYTSSAVCTEHGIFVQMKGEELKNLCQEHPETGILILNRLAGVIAQRLRGTHEKVVELLHQGLNNK
jgi:CRP-like cAMP-binding protein